MEENGIAENGSSNIAKADCCKSTKRIGADTNIALKSKTDTSFHADYDDSFSVDSCADIACVSARFSAESCTNPCAALSGRIALQKTKPRGNIRRVLVVIAAVLLVFALACPTTTGAQARNITKGDTTANIKAVQTRLKSWGYYNSTVDGIWGSKTLAAVKSFQKKNGLTPDGVVGPRTEAALGITLSSSGGGSASSADLNLLARCVYGEARGEPYTGQVAVAAVVLNRIKSSSFPNTVSGVIYEKYAFTCVADGQINLTPNQSAYNAARDALNGSDPTNGCLFYYNPATATSKWIWSLKVELKIGRHSFARA